MSAPELQYMINSMYCGKLTAVGSIIHPINYAVLLAYNSSLTRPMNEAIAKVQSFNVGRLKYPSAAGTDHLDVQS